MGLPGLDGVLGLTSGAVNVFVNRASTQAVEAGDDEAGVDAPWPGLDAGDDALDTVPACGAIVEFLEAAQLLATRPGRARSRARFQPGDMLVQRGGGSDAENVIEPFGTAEAQHLRRAIMAVGPQQDLDTRPVVAQRRDQAAQPEHDLSPARPARRAQEGGDHTALAVEDHDGLETVLVVMGVEWAQLLATVHSVESVVDVEHDA